jgi:hypothetical protein
MYIQDKVRPDDHRIALHQTASGCPHTAMCSARPCSALYLSLKEEAV